MTRRKKAISWKHTIWYYELSSVQTQEIYQEEGPFYVGWLSISPDEEWLLFDRGEPLRSEFKLVENFG